MSTRITISGLSKLFGRGQAAVPAVEGVDLVIEPGELFFLLGPSGCGKTTLLRMIAGFIQPTRGSILFNERDVTNTAPNKRNTGMVFQSYALWPHMTAAGNVAFGLRVRSVASAERDDRVAKALAEVQMAHLAGRKPGEMSGGQQQRVALARALVIRPDVLLLDEPLSNLDARLRIDLRAEIRRICKSAGITTVYVTHDQKEALSIADRIAVMRDGRVVQAGTPLEVYSRPRSTFAASFLGDANLLEGRATTDALPDGEVSVETAIGVLRGTAAAAFSTEDRVIVLIRPETLAISPQGTLEGSIEETTYLGEVARHRVRVAPDHWLELTEFAPGPSTNGRPAHVRLQARPHDVVVLPA